MPQKTLEEIFVSTTTIEQPTQKRSFAEAAQKAGVPLKSLDEMAAEAGVQPLNTKPKTDYGNIALITGVSIIGLIIVYATVKILYKSYKKLNRWLDK